MKNGFNYTAPTALTNPSDLTNTTALTSSARQLSGYQGRGWHHPRPWVDFLGLLPLV